MTLFVLKLLQIREVKWKCFYLVKSRFQIGIKIQLKQFFHHYESQ
jgi:hypothetical protein